jgi:hypothetical protein
MAPLTAELPSEVHAPMAGMRSVCCWCEVVMMEGALELELLHLRQLCFHAKELPLL